MLGGSIGMKAPRCLNSQIREIEGLEKRYGGIPTLSVSKEGEDEVQDRYKEVLDEGDGGGVEDDEEPFKYNYQMILCSGHGIARRRTGNSVNVVVKYGARSSVLCPCEEKRSEVNVRTSQFGSFGYGQRRVPHCVKSSGVIRTFSMHPILPGTW